MITLIARTNYTILVMDKSSPTMNYKAEFNPNNQLNIKNLIVILL